MASISYLLDDWVIYPEKSLIEKDGEVIHLEPKVMEVLVYLLENSNRVVSREELNEKVWQSRYTSDDVITRAISVLRKKLNDHDKVRQYIKTIPKHGYLLDYTPSRNEQIPEPIGNDNARLVTFKFRKRTLFASLALLLVAVALWFAVSRIYAEPEPVKLRIENFTANDNLDESILVAKTLTQQLITTLGNSKYVQVSLSNRLIDAREDNFDYFVGGAVRRIEQDIQVSLHFADAKDGKVIWSQTFAGAADDWPLLVNSVANTLDYFIEVVNSNNLDLSSMSIETMQTELLIHQARQLRLVSNYDNYLTSIQLLENGMRTYPQSVEIPIELGIAYYRAASFLGNAEYLSKMRNLFIRVAPEDMEQGMVFIKALYQYGNKDIELDELINDAVKASDALKNQPEYQSYLGSFYLQLNQFQKAESHLQRALKLEPKLSVATFNYAKLQSRLGHHQSALDTLTSYLNLNYRDYSARYLFAWLLVDTGQFADAIDFLNQTPLKATEKELIILLAQANFYLGDKTTASHYYSRLVASAEPATLAQMKCQLSIVNAQDEEFGCPAGKDGQMGNLIFGRYLMLKGEYQKALSMYQPFFNESINPDNLSGLSDWIDYAWLLSKNGEQQRAEQIARQLKQSTADLNHLGFEGKGISDVVLNIILGDERAATFAFQQAVDKGWQHYYQWKYGGSHPALVAIEQRQGYQQSFKFIERSLQLQRKQLAANKKIAN
ncbi:winged helix-turn-helix domain-containing protein [Thalassotalea sp. PS06]|uniref:winged helix-turn-helix domain-containing protein n=1 Tax=Thalassotalea sp. PS06 TaxID=2594005 RepID=UPI001165ADFA|nr:winged helix-turn-helix domain-containing protein [Thalassotalea sp. PS06]QDP01394.1 hypothetical protein FNC98_08680 [Thalassotalea sp. PS06]